MKYLNRNTKLVWAATTLICLLAVLVTTAKISPLLFYRIHGEVAVDGLRQRTSVIYKRLSNNDLAIRIDVKGHSQWYLVRQDPNLAAGYSLYCLDTDEPNLSTVFEGKLEFAEDGGPLGESMPGLLSPSDPKLRVSSGNIFFVGTTGQNVSVSVK